MKPGIEAGEESETRETGKTCVWIKGIGARRALMREIKASKLAVKQRLKINQQDVFRSNLDSFLFLFLLSKQN